MSRHANAHFVKPTLEHLEERALPSFLFPSDAAVQQLSQPMNTTIQTMQKTAADLKAQFQIIISFGKETPDNSHFAHDLPIAETAYGKAAGDWLRILADKNAIQIASSTAVAFINAVAISEFLAGDPVDLIVLRYGSYFRIPNPTKPITDPVSQANSIVNDPTLQKEINTDFSSLSPLYTPSTIADQGYSTPPTIAGQGY